MLVLLLCTLALTETALTESPQVSTSQGRLRGQVLQSRGGRDYFSFTKVPYAKPPIGERRFKISEKADNWTDVLDATQPIPACYQPQMWELKLNGVEDCLYLNVFSPNLNGTLPVIFSIHGGAFLAGSAITFGSAEYFMDEDVVFVAPNYRLGTMGFLSLEDNVLPGNLGLKDQALALEWVKNEIRAFGGDPNQITVIGESAGGASTDIICSVPRTNGLIKACVSQSGVGYSPWAFTKPGIAREMALNMAKTLGCKDNGDILKCLQSKPIEQVGNVTFLVDNNKNSHIPAPVLEATSAPGALVTSWPTSTNHKYPWIIGVVQDEGLLMTALYESKYLPKEALDKFVNDFNQTVISTFNLKNRTSDLLRIRERFFKNGVEPIKAIRNYFTEVMFVYPSLKSISKHPGPTYFYKFNYTGSPSQYNFTGVPHAAELAFFFKTPSNKTDWPNAADTELSKELVKFWSNFATNQIPSSNSTLQWPQFQGQYFLDIQDSGVTISNWTDYKETLDFWESIEQPSKSSTIQSSLLFVAALYIFTVYRNII